METRDQACVWALCSNVRMSSQSIVCRHFVLWVVASISEKHAWNDCRHPSSFKFTWIQPLKRIACFLQVIAAIEMTLVWVALCFRCLHLTLERRHGFISGTSFEPYQHIILHEMKYLRTLCLCWSRVPTEFIVRLHWYQDHGGTCYINQHCTRPITIQYLIQKSWGWS